ncbi:hypothetical protein U1Q18_030143 [Sarracenia purpurea var. burkii]
MLKNADNAFMISSPVHGANYDHTSTELESEGESGIVLLLGDICCVSPIAALSYEAEFIGGGGGKRKSIGAEGCGGGGGGGFGISGGGSNMVVAGTAGVSSGISGGSSKGSTGTAGGCRADTRATNATGGR